MVAHRVTAFAIGFGAGRIAPELLSGAAWPFETPGGAFALVGLGFIGYGHRRQKQIDLPLIRGQYARLDDRAAFAGVGIMLGVATLILMVPGQ